MAIKSHYVTNHVAYCVMENDNHKMGHIC